jgi:hypothetical protein
MPRITIISLATVMVLAAGAGWRYTSAQESVTKLTPDDYVEIYNLYAKYTRAADMGGKGDGSDWAATFAPDGTFGKAQGPAALKKIISDFHARLRRDGWSSRHTYTTIQLAPAVGGVKGSVYALVFNVTARPPFVDHSGVYDDFLVKTKDGWRFKSRIFKSNTTFKPGEP